MWDFQQSIANGRCVFRESKPNRIQLLRIDTLPTFNGFGCARVREREISWKSLWWTQSVKRQFRGFDSTPFFSCLSLLLSLACVCVWNRKYFHLYANPEIAMFLCYLVCWEEKNRLHSHAIRHMCDNRCAQVIRTKLVLVRSQHVVFIVDHNSDKKVSIRFRRNFFVFASIGGSFSAQQFILKFN